MAQIFQIQYIQYLYFYCKQKVTNAFEDLIDAKRIVREIKLLKFFDHENIISIIDLQKPDARTGYTDIYIITDLMETDLHRVIYSRQDLTDEHIQYFVYQILRGVLYMHSANVIHRDLKPSNLLLNKNCDLKICDLGLCRGYENENDFKTEYVVTRWYRAPEVILNASEYTKAVDIWSVGCIIVELIGRNPLFPGEDYLDQVQRVIAVLGTPSPEDMSYIGNENAIKYIRSLPKRSKQKLENLYPKTNPLLLDLIDHMLTFNPDHRYTVEQCLEHPYFESLHNPEEEPVCEKVFDWSWDNFEPTKEILQNMVYEESLCFHPNVPQTQQQQVFNTEKPKQKYF
ncbi:Protein kinase-like domain [Pseudocohnilembus persalinus]|uniref:Protein kinase-like domain n=1 Tax=Pseudocohnilembus persalinus TaxID=266149 RepID=A0A0V0QVQ1_PSEPJ|nr:Protein kinase-like domain [Pseudocohnilembus persalinus]|eukprot:KRX06315.1 Protein kinase-like domain [Pseudocohnilembus persalinus]